MYLVSKKGYEKLILERDAILKELERQQGVMGWHADMDKDLRENPGFMQTRVKLTYELPYRLRELTEIIKKCKIIEDLEEYKNFDFKMVRIGARVGLQFENGETVFYTILGYGESDTEKNFVSYFTPFAAALLGKSVGDEVELNSPSGVKKAKIISIEKGL